MSKEKPKIVVTISKRLVNSNTKIVGTSGYVVNVNVTEK